MSQSIAPADAKKRIESGPEAALLDVREDGQFGEGHPLLAVPCPYSRLELRVGALVPRKDTAVMLIDDGDGVGERAAKRLAGLGYTDVHVVAGGARSWAAAGFTLFKGVNVPGKTLGEFAEETWHPETMTAEHLETANSSGTAPAFFDVRPPAEYAKMRVPGAVCVPNGELAYRIEAAVPSPETPVVVTCAGRTRGIIGAVGMRLMGIANPVIALENGTQGWALAGKPLERGNTSAPFPAPSATDLEAGAERARTFAARWSIPMIDAAKLRDLEGESARTLYLFDVRTEAEYERGHYPGAVHALGVQLVQSADRWMGVRRARVVLADDNGVRAGLAAFWLQQLGYEVSILTGSEKQAAQDTDGGDRKRPHDPSLPGIDPQEARQRVGNGAMLLDIRHSSAYRGGAPRQAVWTTRPRLERALEAGRTEAVLLADDPDVAELLARDLADLGVRVAGVSAAQPEALAAAGFEIVASNQPDGDAAIDFLEFVHDRHDGNLESSRRYLAWEQGLIAQLDAGERATFNLPG